MPVNRNNYLDFDGALTLIISIFILLSSFGITYILTLFHVYKVAKRTNYLCGTTDIIMVHGMKLTCNKINKDFTLRLNRALNLHDKYRAYILLLGGIGGGNSISEAEAGKQYLIDKGVKLDFILVENQSRYTLENLFNARSLIGDLDMKCCSLLSNRYHLARISAYAKGMNMDITLVAAEKEFKLTIFNLSHFFTETFYLHWYYTGKYWSYATNNTRNIKRIS